LKTTYLRPLAASVLLLATACKAKDEGVATATQAVKAEAPARDLVFAASSHLRVLDGARGEVVGRLDMLKSVNEIAFSPDGRAAFLAASDGLRVVDTATFELRAKWTENPALFVEVSDDGAQLFVLEHFVTQGEGGVPVVHPYSLVTLDLATGAVLGKVEIGDRVRYARPSEGPGRHSLVVYASGAIVLGRPTEPLGQGRELDPAAGLQPEGPWQVRQTVAYRAGHVYVPIEGTPARIMDVDLERGEARNISLGMPAALRGLGVTPDGKTLLANTGKGLVWLDLASASVTGALELPGGLMGCAVRSDGQRAYLAKTVDDKGGAVLSIDVLERRLLGKAHLDDISPWAIGIAPLADR
jgi:hypothetical protein